MAQLTPDPPHTGLTNVCCLRHPDIMINMTTGTVGNKGPMGGGDLGPTGGPIACLERGRPELAALNSGSLNYLKVATLLLSHSRHTQWLPYSAHRYSRCVGSRQAKRDGTWAWPPMLFENPVSKVQTMFEAMRELNVVPECEYVVNPPNTHTHSPTHIPTVKRGYLEEEKQ